MPSLHNRYFMLFIQKHEGQVWGERVVYKIIEYCKAYLGHKLLKNLIKKIIIILFLGVVLILKYDYNVYS